MSHVSWLITAVVLVASSMYVDSASNVTVQPATKSTPKTPEIWMNNFLPDLMKMLGNPNNVTDWSSHTLGNNTENLMCKFVSNLMKLLRNSDNVMNWLSKSPGNKTQNMMLKFMSNLIKMVENPNNTGWQTQNKWNETENMLANFIPNLMKMLGNGKNLTDWQFKNQANGTEHLFNWMNFLDKWMKIFGNPNNITAWFATNPRHKTENMAHNFLSNVMKLLGNPNNTDWQSQTTWNGTENMLANFITNLMKMLGNNLTDWQLNHNGNGIKTMINNFLGHWMKMLGNSTDIKDWIMKNTSKEMESFVRELNINTLMNDIISKLPNIMKMLGNQNHLTNWLSGYKGNRTDNVLVNFLQNWEKLVGHNAILKDWLSKNASMAMESFLSNLDFPSFVNDMLSKLGIGHGNSLKDALGLLFQNASLQNWLKTMLTSNPDFYQGISGMFNQQNNGLMTALMSLVSPVLKRYSDQLMVSVEDGLQGMNISANCSHQTVKVLSGMLSGQMWALQYLDAMGKPQSGLLEGALFWPGSFHECLNIVSPGTEDSFKGNYCMLKIPLPMTIFAGLLNVGSSESDPTETNGIPQLLFPNLLNIQYGVCVPNSCSPEDVGIMINEGFMKRLPESLYGGQTPQVQPVCHTEQHFTKDIRAVIVVCVLAVIGLIILLGTAYDVITLLLWQHRQSCKSDETNFSNVNLSDIEVVPNVYAHIEMSDAEDGDIKEKPVEMLDIDHFKTAIEVKPEAEVTSNGVPHKSDVTANGVSHMTAVKSKEVTSEDKKKRPKPGICGSLLMAFSLYTNTKKLVNTETRAGSLGAIHGVRFLSMTWVVLGHTYVFHLGITNNSIGYSKDFVGRWTAQAITNALVSVDSFFTLSGLLVSYLTLKEMAKVKSAKINWLMFYLHRFWRLTPPYMLIIMTYVSLFQYWGIGPTWQPGQLEPVTCNTHWWKNLLYINNFNMVDSCIGHTWYLANDMQFYIISPLILVPLFYSKIFGLIILGLFFLATFITTGVLSYVNGFKINVASLEYMDKIYVKPWCRIGPYLVGILVGYILFKTKCKVKLHKSTVLLGWCSATVISLATLYGLYGETHGHPLSIEASAVYTALHRTAWGAAIGWVLFACITGYGGIINTFLSWKAFIPLARLTYMTYLIHLFVMYYFNGTAQGPFYVSDITISYMFVGNLFFSYCISFLISLSFEAPFMGLERVIFRRK